MMSSHNGVSLEELLDQVESLRNDVESVRNQIAGNHEPLPKELGIKFLMDEFAELGEFWRHADSRVESALNIYLTGSTIIISAVVVMAQSINQLNVLATAAIFVAVGLALAGVVLARRIVESEVIKAEYFYALDLIRSFFVENADEITPYLILPLAHSPSLSTSGLKGALHTSPSRMLLTGIYLWVGLLLGFAVSSLLWLAIPSWPIAGQVGAGVLILLLSIGYLNITLQHELANRASILESRYQRPPGSDAK